MSEIYKPKTKEELLNDVIERLEDSQFAFACFFDAFKRYLEKVKNENLQTPK